MVTLKKYIAVLLLMVIGFSIEALEVTKGKMKLVLHEDIGRFSLYYLTNVENSTYASFFVDEDPRTTVLSILEGNKVHQIGEGSGFTQTVEETSDGARYTWTSSTLKIIQDFVFISAKGSAIASALKTVISIENISEIDVEVGLRYLFDTYLGESTSHYVLNDGTVIKKESTYTSRNMPDYWISAESVDGTVGLQGALRGTHITVPDTIIFTNWKRINDTSWVYNTKSSRSFSLPPYSVNDSAVTYYYDSETLTVGDTRTITLALGNKTEVGFALTQEDIDSDISNIFDQVVVAGSEDDLSLLLQTDLIAVKDIIKQINKKLENQESITEDDITLIETMLKELETRKEQFE